MASDLAAVDLDEMPPISQKRTQAFVNHFLIETINCLNKVAETCEEKMDEICSQMDRMETMLSILEDKLASIPGVDLSKDPSTGEDVSAPVPKPPLLTSTPEREDRVVEPQPVAAAAQPPPAVEVPQEPAAKPPVDPQLAKFFKMVQFGVPPQAVKLKMVAEGFDPNLLDAGPGSSSAPLPPAPRVQPVAEHTSPGSDASSESDSVSSFSD